MQIKLTAFDTLFFRDGKPFSSGEEVWANGLFPPPPSVIYGALRTALWSRNLVDLAQAGTSSDFTSKLQLKGVFLQKGTSVYLPCPYDVVASKNPKANEAKSILNLEAAEFASSLPTSHVLKVADDFAPAIPLGGKGYVDAASFQAYLLAGETPTITKTEAFLTREPKIGLTRSKLTGSAEEGKLYRVELFRPLPDVGIHVDTNAHTLPIALPEKGFFNMGGEAKSVHYDSVKDAIRIDAPKITGNYCKIVLATPTFFEQGWLPNGINPSTLSGSWLGHQVEIIAVAMDRPQYLGGFDMKARSPKPMRKAVPAGAVYYLKTDANMDQLVQSFHGQCISEMNKAQEGFGLAYVGVAHKTTSSPSSNKQ